MWLYRIRLQLQHYYIISLSVFKQTKKNILQIISLHFYFAKLYSLYERYTSTSDYDYNEVLLKI